MTEFTANPNRTYALVVGIERYQDGSLNVKGGGPANDALEFAKWLRDRGVPEKNIWLCLSPLEENRHKIEQSEQLVEATEQAIFDIITNVLKPKEGDLLYIFWAGHGVIDSETYRRLLCADATQKNWQNLDLNSLLVSLRSDYFQIRHHICIIEACANYLSGGLTHLGGKEFPRGKPRESWQRSAQFVLLAAREGEKAKVNSAGKTGYFSQSVREKLENAPRDCWPPDMKTIAEEIERQFNELDETQISQRPTYFYYQGWNGEKREKHLETFNPPHNIPNSNARKFVGREQELERLHQLLQDNDVVAITDATGQGGVGKTELATQYASDYLAEYSGGCCWLSSQTSDLETQLVEFAIVNFPNFNLPNGLSLAGQVAYCWKNWQPGKALLVFDDVKDLKQIQPYLPSSGSRFKVVITTRRSDLPFARLPLGELQPDAALELLAKLLGEELVEQELEFARKLCKFVNYKPLGLYQIAASRS